MLAKLTQTSKLKVQFGIHVYRLFIKGCFGHWQLAKQPLHVLHQLYIYIYLGQKVSNSQPLLIAQPPVMQTWEQIREEKERSIFIKTQLIQEKNFSSILYHDSNTFVGIWVTEFELIINDDDDDDENEHGWKVAFWLRGEKNEWCWCLH